MNEKYPLSVSIVAYKNECSQLEKVINSVLNSKLKLKLYIIDNSPTDQLRSFCSQYDLTYIYNNANLGFGAAHNIVLEKSHQEAEYHLVLNPDVWFEPQSLQSIYDYMQKNQDIGLLMPKVLYPDQSLQYLCKLLPTPTDWIFRRFCPVKSIIEQRNYKFELKFTEYNKTMDIPYLSGCFMFIRTSLIPEVGGFDTGMFMYGEDTDLSRRYYTQSRAVFYPDVQIYHEFHKQSHKSFRLLWIHIQATIYYFNKWGWFFDAERKRINKKLLSELGYKSASR